MLSIIILFYSNRTKKTRITNSFILILPSVIAIISLGIYHTKVAGGFGYSSYAFRALAGHKPLYMNEINVPETKSSKILLEVLPEVTLDQLGADQRHYLILFYRLVYEEGYSPMKAGSILSKVWFETYVSNYYYLLKSTISHAIVAMIDPFWEFVDKSWIFGADRNYSENRTYYEEPLPKCPLKYVAYVSDEACTQHFRLRSELNWELNDDLTDRMFISPFKFVGHYIQICAHVIWKFSIRLLCFGLFGVISWLIIAHRKNHEFAAHLLFSIPILEILVISSVYTWDGRYSVYIYGFIYILCILAIKTLYTGLTKFNC